MRWDGLFADLEAQAAALEQAERGAEVAERTRGEVGALGLIERLRSATGLSLRLRLPAHLIVNGALIRVGPDWLLLDEDTGREIVVSIRAVLAVRGLARYSASPDTMPAVDSRLGIRHALRGIARDRSVVRVHLADGSTLDGTIDRVGADFAEIASHAAGEPRRRQEVRDVELVPLAALVAVRRTA